MKFNRILLSFLIVALSIPAFAQHLPGDAAVRKGKLENGLTYYIVHNELPAQRAEFYLATNVGALQETPDQDGLAHFLEHMCFNGTKNFPGKGILNYLQSIGASFGGNVNASTGVEETIYMLNNIPLVDATVVDTCLLILHDYSHFVTCDPEEIDKERGVILEEKRSRNDASWRLTEQARPYLYGDTKYAVTTIIGSEENLKTFSPSSLTTFYSTWYRPDMQAVIVVGDVDVDQVEAKIVSTWSDIPAAINPKAKTNIAIPTNEKPAIGILTDPELAATNIAFYWRTPIESEEDNDTAPYLIEDLLKEIVSAVMQERLTELAAKPEAPFSMAQFDVMNICETMDATALVVIPKEGQAPQSIAVGFAEAEKLHRYGVSDGEVERAKASILSYYESAAAKASTRKNSELINPLINNFFDNHEYLSPADKYSLVNALFPQLPTQAVSEYAKSMISDENLVVLYYGPAADPSALPTSEQIDAILNAVKASDIQQNVEQEVAASFLDADALKGSRVKKTAAGIYGSTEMTLKNGAKVVLLPTDYEKDRVSIRLIKKGGRSLIATEDLASFEDDIWQVFQSNQGVAEFSASDVSKMLSGKNVSAQAYISAYTHGVAAASTPKDLETAFQLAYLQYCNPRFDESEYGQSIQMIQSIMGNLESMPQYQFQKHAFKTLYDNPRHVLLNQDVLDAASLETMEKVYKSMFNDAAGLVAVVVGDFDINTVKPLVEKYIGSIPKGRKALNWLDRKDGVRPGVRGDDFAIPMATPKVTVAQVYSLNKPYSAKWDASLDALKYILDMIYTDTLREEEGGTYGASVSANVGEEPDNENIVEIDFETNPDAADKLRALAKEGLQGLAQSGPTADQFDKAIKNMQKVIPENRVRNAYWMNGLLEKQLYGRDFINDYEAAVNALTPADVQNAAVTLLSSGNFSEVVMRPE